MRHSNGSLQCTAPAKSMEMLGRRLAEWRQTHKPPTAIPEELWAEAVGLARQHGVGPTAKSVRLDHGTLKRRVQALAVKDTPAGGTAFMELLLPPQSSNSVPECAIEVESGRGARMCIQIKNAAPAGLAAIIREFVE